MSTSLTNSSPIAELYVDKRKVLWFNFALFMLASGIALGHAYLFYIHDQLFIFIITLVFWVPFAKNSWQYFYKKSHIKLYASGVEIVGAGYWDWADIDPAASRNSMGVSVKRLSSPPQKKNFGGGIDVFSYNADLKSLFVIYQYPFRCTNMPLDAFQREIEILEPAERTSRNHEAGGSVPKSWREEFFGSKVSNFSAFLILVCTFSYLGFSFYGLVNEAHFPAHIWQDSLRCFCLFAVAIIFTFILKNVRAGHDFMPHAYKFYKYFMLVICAPLFCYMMVWVPLSGVGKAVTEITGRDVERIVAAYDREPVSRRQFCFKGGALFLSSAYEVICVDKMYEEKLPRSGELIIMGKESWFGFQYSGYRVSNEDETRI